ncbi:unnamed protein product [Gulo gulo]|uniref:Uncharacterized protein n=1 Tax=Gulo gulo TaxID=48420 RepID=A0A9X9LIM2_GULGU|nr:unnamed protein product [Gulo gulo]
MDKSNLRGLNRKSKQIKNSKTKIELLAMTHRMNLSLKTPTMGMSSTLRLFASSV